MSAQQLSLALLLSVGVSFLPATAQERDAPSRQEVGAALQRAVRFYRDQVSTEGGYLWQYSADLTLREGEGKATATRVWVQTPGTPTVGMAYLHAFQLTGEQYLLSAARDAALALVRGQLQSGGWDYSIEFDPAQRKRYAYRVDRQLSGRNTTTLDDDNTQSALRFLMQMDQQLEFQDSAIHEAVQYALQHLLQAQYPNGAWPQRYAEPYDANDFPVLQASYPDSWSRTFPKQNYMGYYTFNDNTLADLIRTMMLARHIYDEPRYQAAAEKAGDFILLAQMPDPQPAWAQQYDPQMHPAWARKFEPPSVTGGESQGVIRVLMELYRETGKEKYLEPIPRALAYLRSSELPGGRLARFYELQTNRPLYFTLDYQLTYKSDDMPTHYSFIGGSQVTSLQRRYDALRQQPWSPPPQAPQANRPNRSRRAAEQVRNIIADMDSRGAWIEAGSLNYQEGPADKQIISTRTFLRNIALLSQYMGQP